MIKKHGWCVLERKRERKQEETTGN